MAATLSELEQQNPNIRSQMEEWQGLRVNNGQDPADWEAFRQHAQGIGAPDPGEDAPADFAQSASRARSAASSSAGSSTVAAPQNQQYQAPQNQQYQAPQQSQQAQPMQDPKVAEAIRVRDDYEADKNTPTDKWLKARGMTKAQLDAALELAKNAGSR